MRRAWLAPLAMVAACSFDPGGAGTIDAPGGGPDGPPDGDLPPIDADHDAPSACTPACNGTTLITCVGGAPVGQECPQGCSENVTPHCRELTPSNGASLTDLTGVTSAIDIAGGRVFVFDTDDGSIESYDLSSLVTPPLTVRNPGDGVVDGIGFRSAGQGPGLPSLGIWSVTAFTVNPGVSTALHGTARFVGARAAIVLSRGAITVRGVVDAGAGVFNRTCRECGGPGGGNGGTRMDPATGCAPGGNGAYGAADETGGAGGGMSTIGADGGDSDAEGGVAASIATCPGVELIPLQGGSGGGRGGYDASPPVAGGEVGGGGGGAIQLTSLAAISIVGTADVYAGGAGGAGSSGRYGGGGGGAGGAILLEAPTITIGDTARITANGGGGGSGRTSSAGEAGNRGAMRASGGTGDGGGGNDGRGGRGGIASVTGTANLLQEQGNGGVDGTGGGGASAGRVRFNTASGSPSIAAGVTIRPAQTAGLRPLE